MSVLRFAAIGLNHHHVYSQVDVMVKAGAELVSFHAVEDDLAATFSRRFSQAKRLDDRRRILEDRSIDLVLSAAIPNERAGVAIDAMRHSKDVMLAKPGMTSLEQLAKVRKVQAETHRIVSILYSEHFEAASVVKAAELVRSGAIGEVVQMTGSAPYRLRKSARAPWFFDPSRYGGIITGLAAHQCEQFLFFNNTLEAEVVSATVGNRGNPDTPGLQDFGDLHLKTVTANGYVHVNWFNSDGLPSRGGGRLFIAGTEGMIELRKYVDIAGLPGMDHLFLTDRNGAQHIDCGDVELPYGRQLASDIRDRTETAMSQEHCFRAMELALNAQALAEAASSPADQRKGLLNIRQRQLPRYAKAISESG